MPLHPIVPAGEARPGRRRRLALLTFGVQILYVAAAGAQGTDPTTAVHFLEQATFGPRVQDLAAVQAMGPAAWLQQQFNMPESPVPDGLSSSGLRAQVYSNMASGPDQVRQRAIFALSQTIVVSANKLNGGDQLAPWVRLLSNHALGNFRTLLKEVSLSPSMGKYLDNVYNRKATATTSPNENYAREVLQLFSIGLWELNTDGSLKLDGSNNPIPTYSQSTIAEFARALTGWTYPPKPGATSGNSNPEYFVGRLVPTSSASRHDTGAKTLLRGFVTPAGYNAAQDLELVVDNIFSHPNVGPFLATRLIRSLVTSNPSPGYIQRVANAFNNNGNGVRGDLKAVFAAILLDPEALNPSAIAHGRLKDPLLHIIGLGRALNAQLGDPSSFQYVFTNLSERVLTPTTVFSFYSPLAKIPSNQTYFGPEFQLYPPALAIQRANFIYGILNGNFGASFRVDLTPYQAIATNPDALVDKVNNTLMMGRMSATLRQLIINATAAVPPSDTRQRALGALYLAAISGEYSVYSGGVTASSVIPTTVQGPSNLYVASVQGNVATLRWTPPALGPAPDGYVLEGGTKAGETLASVPTGSTLPGMTITAPSGQFYVRIKSSRQGVLSFASNEVKLNVNAAIKPSTPAYFQAGLMNRSLWLAWRNTFTGGTPTSLALDVTGPVSLTVPLGLSESFALDGLPDGTWTFRLRALNAYGTSGQSGSATVTAPSDRCNQPGVPANFTAEAAGHVLNLSWDSPLSGTPATGYLLHVSGTYSASVPMYGRGFSAAVPPGQYTFILQAVNACGGGPMTPYQIVTVR
ncbi:MAG: DUF1800 family protein [Vicinamibacterales bacterium]